MERFRKNSAWKCGPDVEILVGELTVDKRRYQNFRAKVLILNNSNPGLQRNYYVKALSIDIAPFWVNENQFSVPSD